LKQRILSIGLCLLVLLPVPLAAQSDLLPCSNRPTIADPPWINGDLWCLEWVVNQPDAGEMAFTAIAAGENHTLYATRPFSGQVFEITDSDGDGLPDKPHVVADGLTLPNGLAYHNGALYISGGSHLYRLTSDRLETLVDDLPAGSGFWTGGLTVGPDERIYAAIGAPCDYCQPDNPERGSILSFALDGSNRQVVASGLRQPSDVTFLNGQLWTLDSARDELFDTPNLDELNRVMPGANFGWPYCIGQDNRSDWPDHPVDCSNMTPPEMTFPTGSHPMSIAAYQSDTFPFLKNALLIVLNGSYNRSELRGYTLAAVQMNAQQKPDTLQVLIPTTSSQSYQRDLTTQEMQYRGSGFWPHRPFAVAVSPEGWIYISAGGGHIYALRPNAQE
jgi:glucose/arabinose dehydrogenase